MKERLIFDETMATEEVFKALGIWDEILKTYQDCLNQGIEYAKILFRKAVINLVIRSDHHQADQSEDENEAQK